MHVEMVDMMLETGPVCVTVHGLQLDVKLVWILISLKLLCTSNFHSGYGCKITVTLEHTEMRMTVTGKLNKKTQAHR